MMQPASDFMQHRESSPPQPEHFPKGCTDRAILLLLCSGFSVRKIFAGPPVFVARKQGTFCPLTPFYEGG